MPKREALIVLLKAINEAAEAYQPRSTIHTALMYAYNTVANALIELRRAPLPPLPPNKPRGANRRRKPARPSAEHPPGPGTSAVV